MMNNKLVSIFDSLVYRRPAHNIITYLEIPNTAEKVSLFVRKLYNDNYFRNSVYIASPELYNMWMKLYDNTVLDNSKKDKIENNIIKYYIRSIFNCSPFGLFSGYSILNKQENSQKDSEILYVNYCYIQSMIDEINNIKTFRSFFKYNLNNTIYKIGNALRYMEYNNEKGYFELSQIDIDPVINFIYKRIKFPISISDMEKILLDKIEGINYDVINNYINDLIDSQFLISDFQILINNGSPTEQFKELINRNEMILNYLISKYNINHLFNNFKDCDLIQISQRIKNKFTHNILKNQSVFNSNLKIKTKHNYKSIIEEDKNKISDLVYCLERLTRLPSELFYRSELNIKIFTSEFQKRYEEQELPLLKVLDPETGIGYLNNHTIQRDIIPNLEYSNNDWDNRTENVVIENKKDSFFIKKITDALLYKAHTIKISKKDLENFEVNNKFRGTYSLVYSKIMNKIAFFSGGGGTAQHYIGRFTAFDKDLIELSSSISIIEKESFANRIVAEIVHLPNHESGNIINRCIKRNYEIPIYSTHSKNSHPIFLNDIMISVKNERLILRSKKYNKEIIPFLSCAHNYLYNTTPVYKFLCDIQCLYRSNILSFDLSSVIKKNFKYIPRIEYENSVILLPSTWCFMNEDLNGYIDSKGNIIKEKFANMIRNYNIPRFIDLIENSDSRLTIDLNNKYLFEMLNHSLKKFNKLYFQENLYLNNSFNKETNANQIILFFKNNITLPPQQLSYESIESKRKFIPGDEWLYYKFYCNSDFASIILIELYKSINTLHNKQLIDKWFFIKLYDPDFHIRLRVHLTSKDNISSVFSFINQKVQKYIKTEQLKNIVLDTYVRELERYFDANIDLIESIFYIDSEFVIKVIKEIKTNNDWENLWLYGLKGIDSYLNLFGFNIQKKIDFTTNCYELYCHEFKINKKSRKEIDLKFRGNNDDIYDFFYSGNKKADKLFKRKEFHIKRELVKIKSCLNEKDFEKLAKSTIHMFINRLFITKQRLNEMVLYGILTKFYKKEFGRNQIAIKQRKRRKNSTAN